MKIDFLFLGSNLNIIIQKNARKMHVLQMKLQKQADLSMLRLDCCLPPPIQISGYAPVTYYVPFNFLTEQKKNYFCKPCSPHYTSQS